MQYYRMLLYPNLALRELELLLESEIELFRGIILYRIR